VALLRILVERAGALVSKNALMEAAWPGRAVEDSNLTVQIAALDRDAPPSGLSVRRARCHQERGSSTSNANR
jgi:DNA-binding winged helix-turn-helix (wHTH) protein